MKTIKVCKSNNLKFETKNFDVVFKLWKTNFYKPKIRKPK